MSQDLNTLDPYGAVLADLRAQRDKIDNAIEAIEALRGGTGAGVTASKAEAEHVVKPDEPGWLLGLSIPDGARKVLANRKRAMTNAEMWNAFKSGGLHLSSADPINTVGSVLMRRFNTHGDIVRVDRGVWGLSEWYPGRSFKKKPPKTGPALDAPEDDALEGL